MSTIKLGNMSPLTGSSTNAIQGLAKAWVVLEAVGVHSIFDSLNNSSIVDVRTGVVRINLSVTMKNSGYAMTQSCVSTYENTTGSNGRVGISCPQYEGRLNTISYEITQKDSNAVVIDSSRITSLIYGDSA